MSSAAPYVLMALILIGFMIADRWRRRNRGLTSQHGGHGDPSFRGQADRGSWTVNTGDWSAGGWHGGGWGGGDANYSIGGDGGGGCGG